MQQMWTIIQRGGPNRLGLLSNQSPSRSRSTRAGSAVPFHNWAGGGGQPNPAPSCGRIRAPSRSQPVALRSALCPFAPRPLPSSHRARTALSPRRARTLRRPSGAALPPPPREGNAAGVCGGEELVSNSLPSLDRLRFEDFGEGALALPAHQPILLHPPRAPARREGAWPAPPPQPLTTAAVPVRPSTVQVGAAAGVASPWLVQQLYSYFKVTAPD